jgi:murein DD-endopeptidase MepM/ murein hydrolase activator NlpD
MARRPMISRDWCERSTTFRFLACLVAALLLEGLTGSSRSNVLSRLVDQKQRVHTIHERLLEKRSALEETQRLLGDLRHRLGETNASYDRTLARLVTLGGEIQRARLRVASNRLQLAAAEARLQRHDNAYRARFVQIYEKGDLQYLSVLVSSASFSDFVERWEDIKYLIAADQRAIIIRRQAAHRTAEVQTRLERGVFALQDTERDAESEKSKLAALSVERSQLVDIADRRREEVAREVTELEEVSARQESDLENLIIERQREVEAARQADRRESRQLGHRGSSAASTGTGQLMWPVAGPITSPFGLRMHPIYHRLILHEGIDIGAPMSTTIKAADAGRIIVAGWVGGYGNYVGIDHGDGISTGYGHCSAIFVSVGQDVQKGQAIAAVGSTGNSTGPHIHFEVRVRGRPVDPMGYLR